MAAFAFLLVCWQVPAAGAQVAGMARFGTVAPRPTASASGQVLSPIGAPTSAYQDSSPPISNVRRHVVIGAAVGVVAAVALASFEMKKCADRSPQSDKQACAIILVAAVPVTGLFALTGGMLGWMTADHPHPAQRYSPQ